MFFPEHASITAFVQFLHDEDRRTYTHEDLLALAEAAGRPTRAIRLELDGWGARLEERPFVKVVRGFSDNPNNRFQACPSHGGAAYTGMMVAKYGSKDMFVKPTPNKQVCARK